MRRKARFWALPPLMVVCLGVGPPQAAAAVRASSGPAPSSSAAASSGGTGSLESAAAKAGDTGRAVAMSLIGLGFAVAGTVLVFRRDFKEAAGVFAGFEAARLEGRGEFGALARRGGDRDDEAD